MCSLSRCLFQARPFLLSLSIQQRRLPHLVATHC
ncbi:MAG: hypothetical protein RJB41_854, partial [Actinomycetota bacterium]